MYLQKSQKSLVVANSLRYNILMIIRPCENCGKEMRVSPSWNVKGHYKRHCSKACQRTTILIACEICGEEVERTELQIEQREHHYCSNACKVEGRKNSYMKECEVCGEEFKTIPARLNAKYCSQQCHGEAKVTGKEKECEICGKVYWAFKSAEARSGARYCSQECAVISIRSKDFDPQGRSSVESMNWVKQVKKRDKCCQKCGEKKRLHAHHILSWKDYPELRFKINNGIALCESCHIETHRKAL